LDVLRGIVQRLEPKLADGFCWAREFLVVVPAVLADPKVNCIGASSEARAN